MSYHVVQPKWFLHEITRSRNHSAPTDSTPQPLTPLMPHLRNETFYFDTVDESDEFRVAAAAIKLKYHPSVPPTRHVTQEDLQGFEDSRTLLQMKLPRSCVMLRSRSVLCVLNGCLMPRGLCVRRRSWMTNDMRKQMLYHTDFSQNTML
jgi:hypothetical protein